MTADTGQTETKQSRRKDDRRDAASEPELDMESIRNQIAARLMRLHCGRQHGCTRRCRRLGRCAAADEVDALAGIRLAPAAKRKGPAGEA